MSGASKLLSQCPCCDYFSLRARGAYEICRICYWEDDGQDLDEFDRSSGPNHITLREGRRNFERWGAADESAASLVVSEGERAAYRRELRASVH